MTGVEVRIVPSNGKSSSFLLHFAGASTPPALSVNVSSPHIRPLRNLHPLMV